MRQKTFILAAVLILIMATTGIGLAEDLVIIVNAKNPIGELSPPEVRRYFLKEHSSWPSGERIRSVDRNGPVPERRVFLDAVIKYSSDQLEQYWIGKRYEKGIPVPPKLASDREVIEYVSSFDGAIGYVNSKSIEPSLNSKIKVVGRIPVP